MYAKIVNKAMGKARECLLTVIDLAISTRFDVKIGPVLTPTVT